MAFTINSPKSVFLKPFFILLVIILVPFALLFSLIRLPFAKRRISKLSEILKNDWQVRRKYVYVGLTKGYPLSDFVKERILSIHKENIVWDEWDGKQNEWKRSEPDDIGRITIFWQDIGGEFDGDPMIIIATYGPDSFEVTQSGSNFHRFMLNDNDQSVLYDGKKLATKDAEKEIQKIISHALAVWSK